MKKYFAIAMMVCTMATLSACGGNQTQNQGQEQKPATQTEQQQPAENQTDGQKPEEQKPAENTSSDANMESQVFVMQDDDNTIKEENLPKVSLDKAAKKFTFEYTSPDGKSYTVNGDLKEEDGKLTLSSEADKFELVLKYLSDDQLKYSDNESKPIEFSDGTKLELKSNAAFSLKK